MNKKDLKDETILNEEILEIASEVRCLKDDGTQLGVIATQEALSIALKEELDLVLIAPTATPPVCKIMNYGKFKYQEEKKKKEAKKKQKQIDIKEIKLSVKIAQNDVNYKVKHAMEFLDEGKHVKFKVFLKGREVGDPESANVVLHKVYDMMQNVAIMEKEPKVEGRYVSMYLVPKRK